MTFSLQHLYQGLVLLALTYNKPGHVHHMFQAAIQNTYLKRKKC